jgi:predicted Zn-dependent peptidase
MEKEFIPYEQALALKEIGFDEPCFGYYLTNLLTNKVKLFIDDRKGFSSFEKTTPAPIFSQVFRFFREEHKLSYSIELIDNSRHYYFDFTIYDSENRDYNDEDCFDSCKRIYNDRKFGKYEEAELEALKKLIKIVKNK